MQTADLNALKENIKALASGADAMSGSALALLNNLHVLDRMPAGGDTGEPGNPFLVIRYFADGARSFSYSSWYPLWGGMIGAAHSDDGLETPQPNFASGMREVKRPAKLDFVGYGITLPKTPPRQLVIGEPICMDGYPAGSKVVDRQTGKVYMQRPADTLQPDDGASWIIDHDRHQEPNVGGKSGGCGHSPDTGEPLAIIVTQNGKADVNFDGYKTHSSDVVSLRDVYDALLADGYPVEN